MKAAINHPQAPTAQQWRRMVALATKLERYPMQRPDGVAAVPSRRFACQLAVHEVKPDALPEVIEQVQRRMNQRELAGADF